MTIYVTVPKMTVKDEKDQGLAQAAVLEAVEAFEAALRQIPGVLRAPHVGVEVETTKHLVLRAVGSRRPGKELPLQWAAKDDE